MRAAVRDKSGTNPERGGSMTVCRDTARPVDRAQFVSLSGPSNDRTIFLASNIHRSPTTRQALGTHRRA